MLGSTGRLVVSNRSPTRSRYGRSLISNLPVRLRENHAAEVSCARTSHTSTMSKYVVRPNFIRPSDFAEAGIEQPVHVRFSKRQVVRRTGLLGCNVQNVVHPVSSVERLGFASLPFSKGSQTSETKSSRTASRSTGIAAIQSGRVIHEVPRSVLGPSTGELRPWSRRGDFDSRSVAPDSTRRDRRYGPADLRWDCSAIRKFREEPPWRSRPPQLSNVSACSRATDVLRHQTALDAENPCHLFMRSDSPRLHVRLDHIPESRIMGGCRHKSSVGLCVVS